MTKITDIPAIRFKGFSDTWEQRKVREVTDRYDNLRIPVAASLRVAGTTPYYGANGIQDYVDGYTHDGEFILVAEDGANDLKNYPVKCVKGRIWVNNHAHVLQGKYDCADNQFLAYAISQADIESLLVGGGRAKLNAETLMGIDLLLTNKAEQIRIGKYLAQLDNLITLHQREFAFLCKEKSKKFRYIKNAWEQRKFSDLVQIERGGSPRPIDDFITDSPDGLNWVKIGDAPAQGNYITKTAEKIKPEGLSKTREVHPGDLILSNSMSFGKPYIMGIDGCIHDGWLLIRNTYKVFDLTFLCHLLGTPQMIIQYKSLAAGSTVNNLNKELVGNTVVTIPTIKEQRVLGQYLETLDNLITLHQRKYDKLTNVKKSMLEKMFPQNGSNVPEIRFKGFTEAWEQRKLGEIGSVSMCRRIFKEQTSENGEIPFYKIGTFGGEADAFISRELFEEYKAKYQYPKKGDILISASGSIGRTVVFTGKNEYFQDSNIVWLNHDKHLDNSFLKCFYSIVKWAGIEGSTIKRLYNDNILNTAITLPSVEEQQKIGAYFENLDNLITLHQRELEKLKNLKKACLEKMFV